MSKGAVVSKRARSVAGLSALVLGLIGCATEAAPGADEVAEWSVDSLPLLTLGLGGEADSAITFTRITGATRLPDGQLLVADLGDAPLRLFAADGTLTRVVARKGAGPGEMEYLAWLYRCGDAIFAEDIDGRRISEYGTDAVFRRVFRFQIPAGQQTPYLAACNANGRFAYLGWGARGARTAGYHRDTVPVWISRTADGAPTVIDSVPASDRWGQTYEGRLVGSMPLPLGKQPSIAFGPQGFYIATGDAFEVLAYDTLGVKKGSLRLADTVPAVSPEDVRDFVEAEVAEAGERRRASIEREYAAITFPVRHGAITGLRVDTEGLVWIRGHSAPSAPSAAWRALDSGGREIAKLLLPRRLEVFEIGRDYVLGRQLDADEGVPVLQLWRLARPSR